MLPWITSVRILLDTNILISGLITPTGDRPPALLLDAVRQQRVTLVSSAEQLAEFKDVAGRPHLQKYLQPGVLEDFLRFFDSVADIVYGPLPVVTESPDPKDNMILASALACPRGVDCQWGQAARAVAGNIQGYCDRHAGKGAGAVEGTPERLNYRLFSIARARRASVWFN